MQEYTQLRMVSAYAKGSETPFSTEKPYNWREDAACEFQPPELFEIADRFSPISKGLSLEVDPREEGSNRIDVGKAIKDLNADNFKRAQEICGTCPVWHSCYAEADVEDFQWTVRAGILPTKYNPVHQGRPVDDYKECPKGHSKKRRSDGKGWYCQPCINEKAVERRKKNGSPPPIQPREKFSRGKLCKKGEHDLWMRRSDGTHQCAPCTELRPSYRGKIKS